MCRTLNCKCHSLGFDLTRMLWVLFRPGYYGFCEDGDIHTTEGVCRCFVLVAIEQGLIIQLLLGLVAHSHCCGDDALYTTEGVFDSDDSISAEAGVQPHLSH
ncbi:hypothetical protein V6N13_109118 [Hibiscus sabdariffa]|uniref:Uncharacterized protein n=1 Tax=Hibiscus sabdariffa TaxID=183260 RepID=A0ABR2FNX8_9ROSI